MTDGGKCRRGDYVANMDDSQRDFGVTELLFSVIQRQESGRGPGNPLKNPNCWFSPNVRTPPERAQLARSPGREFRIPLPAPGLSLM